MPSEATKACSWRAVNTITDWEFSEIGSLLCDHAPRDLALMVVRLQGRLGIEQILREVLNRE